MTHKNIRFADMESLLSRFGFQRFDTPAGQIVFENRVENSILIFPTYQPDDIVQTPHWMKTRWQLDAHGFLESDDFDRIMVETGKGRDGAPAVSRGTSAFSTSQEKGFALIKSDDAVSETERHTQTYRIRNNRVNVEPPRVVDVHANPEQIRHLEEEGYLVRERLIQGELLERLRAAADELEAEALTRQKPGERVGFGGLFVRNLLDRHPTFLELLKFAPTLSVARAVLGPQVQIHGSVLRVAYPALQNQQVEWHFHQRVVPDPKPAFFYRPVVVDNLIYLDDLTPQSGPLVVLPRTHLTDEDLPSGDFADKPGQVVITVPAGSCVTSHSSLWHRALSPSPTNQSKRRLLILGYSPVWMKPIDRPSVAGCGGGLTDAFKDSPDAEIRELLGLSGYY